MKTHRYILLIGAACLAAFSVPAADASAQAGRERVLEGNRLYAEGRYAEAHQKYLEAMAEAPGSPVIPFNDGNALYQDADYQRAMEAYQRAIESGDPQLANAAWYNLGNALYRAQELQQSLEAYKQALRMNPSDPDAKHNLERVLQQMQEQQQQQQQDGDQQQDDQESQDDQNQQNQNQDDQQQDGAQGDQDQNQDQPPQDQGQDEQSSESDTDQPPQEGEGQAPRQPGEMTREEAERLLDAVEENPEDVNRKAASRGRRPKKPW